MAIIFASILLFSFSSKGESFEILPGIIEISHHRQDLILDRLLMQVICFDQNGNASTCEELRLNGQLIEVSGFELPANSRTTVSLPQVNISYQSQGGQYFCVGMKVLFEGFPNQCDSVLYPSYPNPRARDRYSILSFCSKKEIHGSASSRFDVRRVTEPNDYRFFLKQLIPLSLTDAKPSDCQPL